MPNLGTILELLQADQFDAAQGLAEDHLEAFPDDIEFVLKVATSIFEYSGPELAIDLLSSAAKRHPNNPHLLEQIGKNLWFTSEFVESEQSLRLAFDAFPIEDIAGRSRCLKEIGDSLWDREMEHEAIDAWRAALRIDPTNEDAAYWLRQNEDENGEPRKCDPYMPDVFRFMDFHMRRVQSANRRAPSGEKADMRLARDAIYASYELHVRPIEHELEEMTDRQKEAFFETIDIDWNADVRRVLALPPLVECQKSKSRTMVILDNLRNPDGPPKFDFMTNVQMILAFRGRLALAAVGITEERLFEVIENRKATKDEVEKFLWAAEIALEVFTTLFSVRKKDLFDNLRMAEEIAGLYLDGENARTIVSAMHRAMIQAREDTLENGLPS